MSWGEARRRRRWQRRLEQQLAALPTFTDDTPDGGPVAPLEPWRAPVPVRQIRPPRPTPPERRRTLRTVGVTLLAIVALLTFGGPGSERIKAALGIGGRGDASSYAFLSVNAVTGDPVTWSSCAPIVYEVNPTGAPADWQQLMGEATAAVSDASGLEFRLHGTSSSRDIDRTSLTGAPPPVLVEWAEPSEQPRLAGDTLGFAGPHMGAHGRYDTGAVVLDAGDFAEMEQHGEHDRARAVLMHELGHLVGLDHVDDDRQLMYRTTTYRTTFGTGDLEGLRRLGHGPCR